MPTINTNFSTTRRLRNLKPQPLPSFFGADPNVLFLPPHPKRRDEGGLRKKGHYKEGASADRALPLITVITVVFNGAVTLEKSICSVIEQNFDNVEYLIIDGGSTDGSVELLKKYDSAIDYWVSEPDAGIYDAFNKAVMCSTGDWICFMGADDYFFSKMVLSQMSRCFLRDDDGVKLVYGNIALLDSEHREVCRVGEAWHIAKNKFNSVMAIPHPGLMHHRTWFAKYGLFDTSFRIAGDYEMLLRGWPREDAVFVADCVVVGMALGGVSSSPENAIKALKETRRAQKIHGINLPSVRLFFAFASAYASLYLKKIFGEVLGYRLINLFRKCVGKPPSWIKL